MAGVNDDVADGDRLVTVTFTAVSTDNIYSGQSAIIETKNVDNDDAGVNFYATSPPSTYEEFANKPFDVVVKLLSRPFSDVLFTVKSSDRTEGLVANGNYLRKEESVSFTVSPRYLFCSISLQADRGAFTTCTHACFYSMHTHVPVQELGRQPYD